MSAQGRLGDKANVALCAHGCPACPHPATGPAIAGSPNVQVNSRPALRVDDAGIHAACCGPNQWRALQGSATVFINGKAAHRVGDATQHCGGRGQLVEGSPNVMVGGSTNSATVKTDAAGWRVDPSSATAANANAAVDPYAAQRAAMQHAAESGAGLVKHDCARCTAKQPLAVTAVDDPAARQADRDDDAMRAQLG
jgi:uncharacterized Zn-binding protein involved in type VI secretion